LFFIHQLFTLPMFAARVPFNLIDSRKLRAADRAAHAPNGLLCSRPACVFCCRVRLLIVLIKLRAGCKGYTACLTDKLILCHIAWLLWCCLLAFFPSRS
jgi:hypothetical protein